MTQEQLKRAGVEIGAPKDGWYETKRLPKSLDFFEAYELWVEPGVGLCKVRAVGRTISSSSFGDQVKSEFNALEKLLLAAYGRNKQFDFLRGGSIWADGNEWMMSMLKKERTLASFWDESEGSTMKDHVLRIALYANGLSISRGFIEVVYEFDNVMACVDKRTARKSGAL